MPLNITYLLGAGASANCLPVLNELPDKLNALRGQMISRINPQADKNYTLPDTDHLHDYAQRMIDDIESLLHDLKNHNTIDTLAKKYYLTGQDDKLLKLKKILIVYFSFEQAYRIGEIRSGTLKELPDKRYDSFIATIIDKKIKSLRLPPNFKIITWNYDRQFEIAYGEYMNEGLENIQRKIQAVPTRDYLDNKISVDLNEFAILRLNGIAGLESYISSIAGIEPNSEKEELRNLYKKVVELYYKISEASLKVFNYSWEDSNDYKGIHNKMHSIKETAKNIMRQTDILVIIGYSFPLFNRSVDNELMKSLTPNLQRIYVQDIKDRGTEIKNLLWESFGNLVKNRSANFIKEISYTNQFFIPPEADI